MGVIFLCPAIRVYSVLKDKQKKYFRHCQVSKKTCTMFVEVKHHWSAPTGRYMDKAKRA